MPTPTLMPSPRQRFTDAIGLPLVNGMLFTYAAGTSTPKEAYQDAAGTIPHQNPIRLDARGEATIYWVGNYKVDLKNALGVQIAGYPVDNFNTDPVGLIGQIADFIASIAAAAGSAIVGFIQAGITAVKRTVQAKLRETISVTDFTGADPTGVTDSLAAFNSAPDGSMVPAGTYKLSAHVIGKTFYTMGNVVFTGAGSAKVANLLSETNGGFVAIDAEPYPGTSLNYKSEPNVVATKSGKMLAVYRIGDAHVNGASNITSYLVAKTYDPATGVWGELQTIASRAGFDTRNHVVGINDATGRIFVFYVQNEYDGSGNMNETTRGTFYKYSDDNGVTWSAAQGLSASCPYPTLDNVPFGKVVSFANGSLLMSIYNYHTIVTLKSTNNGVSWGSPVTVYTTPVISDDNITEPTIVKTSETDLVCIARCIPMGLVGDGTITWKYLGRRWVTATRVEVGMTVYISGRIYYCTDAGTTGATAPVHTSGSAADGTATMAYAGAYTTWAASTIYVPGNCTETYSAYLYQCQIGGTSGTTAPVYITLEGNETQIAYFKSDDGGATWSAPYKVTWTDATYRVTCSPPTAVVVGGEVHVGWFARSPEWTAYHVRMQASAFFQNPDWAFAKVGGEPRQRLMRSFIYPVANNFEMRVDCGYLNFAAMPNSRDVMAAWYDSSLHVNPYASIIQG